MGTTARSNSKCLSGYIARNGLPSEVIGDNGPLFKSTEKGIPRTEWCTEDPSILNRPCSKEKDEIIILTFRNFLKSSTSDPGSTQPKIQNYFPLNVQYHTAYHTAQLSTERKLKTKFIHPIHTGRSWQLAKSRRSHVYHDRRPTKADGTITLDRDGRIWNSPR